MKYHSIFLLLIVILLSACSSPQTVAPSFTPSTIPTVSKTPTISASATSTATIEATPSATPTIKSEPKAFIDMSGATLGYSIPSECTDQFPITLDDQGIGTICVVFDNWVFYDFTDPLMLDGGYEVIAAAEVWFQQDGEEIPLLLPLGIAHRKNEEINLVNSGPRMFVEAYYDKDAAKWERQLKFSPGMTLNIMIAMPEESLARYNTGGFGFEAVAYTQADIDALFATGDVSGFGNILWPVIEVGNAQDWPPTPVPPTLTPITVSEADGKATFNNEGVGLEHEIDLECVNQFPIIPNAGGAALMCVTFDNWIFGREENPFMLNGNYEMVVGAEGWYEQNGTQIPMLIPLATANRDNNEMQVNGTLIRSFSEGFYRGGHKFWESQTHLQPGMTLNITLAIPSDYWAENSTQGFGFEATTYTQADLETFFATGDASVFGNILWPVIDIGIRTQ